MFIGYKKSSCLFKCMIFLLCSASMLVAGNLEFNPCINGDILLSFTLLDEDIKVVPLGKNYMIQIDGCSGHVDGGMPDLPIFVKVLDGKPNESLEVKLLPSKYVVVTQNIDVVAVARRETIALDPPNSITREVRRESPVVYSKNVFWPKNQVEVTEAWQGNRKLLRIAICPVQYNPVSRVLRACTHLEAILKVVPSIKKEGARGPICSRLADKVGTEK